MVEKIKLGLTWPPNVDASSTDRPWRSIKLVQPACEVCQAGKNVASNWAEKCPHDPYVDSEPILHHEQNPIEKEVELADGTTTTRVELGPVVDWLEPQRRVRLVQVGIGERISSGRAVQIKLAMGYKAPESFEGGKPYCEYGDCWMPVQIRDPLYGSYCSALHRRLIELDTLGEPVYIGSGDGVAKRAGQLGAV